MSSCKECCTKLPIATNYRPKGVIEKISDMEVYIVGDPKANITLLGFYDIFGFQVNTFQVCDMIAMKGGFQVILPDFFRGKPWPIDDMPPKDIEARNHWARVENSWEARTRPDLLTLLPLLKEKFKLENIGGFGFCWGGNMVFEGLRFVEPLFKCGVAIHPSPQTASQISSITHPVQVIITEQEQSMLDKEGYIQHSISKASRFHNFTDMEHGFCASRGDFGRPDIQLRVQDTVDIIKNFFKSQF